MAASVTVRCPECDFRAAVRLLGGDEDEIGLARAELKTEHPDHTSTQWKFIEERNGQG
jgi:hypothetical protein